MPEAEAESVQVAVRMRPFNRRETDAKAHRVVRMERQLKGSNTFIMNPETKDEKKFSFDFSFQSHSETEQGIGEWCTQDMVFEDLGRPLMTGALEGRNICLFAYGQTGAGKSFSMLGAPGKPGIIPRICQAIFVLINENTEKCYEFTVDIQVVEVYCEQLNDLLADRKVWPPGGLRPKLTDHGYVVENCTAKPCFSYSDIEHAFEFSDKNRSVGSHALNPESSRAHTIYTINYQRKKRHETGKIVETVTARLNLVDLAGSERTSSAGTSGQMLKEGNAINLSLTALGQCIKALSEQKKPNFRDSKLTLLLQGSMTNGKVVMIAAVSPASICYEESMSTLRFAERIKQVKIRVSKNVSADPVAEMKKVMEGLRAEMQAEIDALRLRADGSADPAAMDTLQDELRQQEEEQRQMREEYERKLKEMEETTVDRAARAADISSKQQKALGGASLTSKEDMKDPHLLNLHEDPRLAETLVYPLKAGVTVIGRMNKEKPPDLEFNGMGMVKNHATCEWVDEQCFITPAARSRTIVNGKTIEAKTELKHNYRVWLGNNYAFKFAFPGKEEDGEQFEEGPDYVFAEQEIAENASAELTGSAAGMIPAALNQKLSEALKKVEQANIIAMDLSKQCEFEAKLYKNRISGETDVVVKVINAKGEMYWPWEKFNERLTEFSTEWQQFQYCVEREQKYERDPSVPDPFDDKDYQLIGEADVWLQSVANMIQQSADAAVLSITGEVEGRLKVDLMPCDRNGKEGPWDDDEANDPFVDDPNDLLGEEVEFCVKIHNLLFDTVVADGGQTCKFANTWIRYKLDMRNEEESWTRTDECVEATFNPKYDFNKHHKIEVDQHVLHLFTKGRIVFQVWGKLASDATNPESPRGRTRAELAKVEQEIALVKKRMEEVEKQLKAKGK